MRRSAAVIVCIAALGASSIYAAKPQPVPNSVKYRDAGAKPATGRSGSAAIQARALRSQTETTVEVTTGQFDGAAAPAGKLDKVQVKLFALTSDDVIATDNYRSAGITGGTASFAYPWPARGERFQVQANVSGIDPKRTDVVTVGGTVKMRPDPTVASLSVPSTAIIGTVVTIDAVIREGNGDLGARANCVLKVDGAVTDHADGIWVDAGDAVTCQFRQVFTTLGQKQLSVELTNVVPADYDTSNNSKSAAIQIVPATTPVWYNFDAEDTWYDQTDPQHGHEEFTSFDPNYPSYVRDYVGGFPNTTHVVSYGANLQLEKALEFPVAIEGRLIVDGQTLVATSGSVDYNPNSFMGFSGDGYWNKCGDYFDGWHSMFMCHFHSEFDGVVRDLSTVYSSANAGAVTYDSWRTSTTVYGDGTTDVYTYNFSGDYITGDVLAPFPASLGNHVDVQGSFTDATNQHVDTTVGVDLFPFPDYSYDFGEYCSTFEYTSDGYGHFSYYDCSYPITLVHGTQGSSYGQIQQ
jgi:hypothetical protein